MLEHQIGVWKEHGVATADLGDFCHNAFREIDLPERRADDCRPRHEKPHHIQSASVFRDAAGVDRTKRAPGLFKRLGLAEQQGTVAGGEGGLRVG